MEKCTFCGRESDSHQTKTIGGYTILECCTDCEEEISRDEEMEQMTWQEAEIMLKEHFTKKHGWKDPYNSFIRAAVADGDTENETTAADVWSDLVEDVRKGTFYFD